MKVGIVTLYNAFNYGAFLQVYAMQKYLQSLGLEVEVIDYYKTFFRKYSYFICRPTRLPMKIKKQLVYSKDKKLLNVKKKGKYDLVFIGSDEIWNIKNNFYHAKEFFGEDLEAKRKIAYAPSCGYTKPEEIYTDEKYINSIKKLDNVYARDENTKIIAEKILRRNIERVVDPTFLYLDKWEEEKEKVDDIEEDFILYYSYHDYTYAQEKIIRFAKENNLKIYSVGFKYKWCDKSLIVSPKQFLYLMQKAKYVATTTFHGSIFCNIFKKDYIVFNANSKTIDLLDMINSKKDKYYTKDEDYESFIKKITTKSNYEEVYNILEKEINKSKKIIENEIKKTEEKGYIGEQI